jgi:hypothetical protein
MYLLPFKRIHSTAVTLQKFCNSVHLFKKFFLKGSVKGECVYGVLIY